MSQKEDKTIKNAITESRVISAAADLLSEQGENVEYDRALAELTCALLDVSTDHKDMTVAALRELRP